MADPNQEYIHFPTNLLFPFTLRVTGITNKISVLVFFLTSDRFFIPGRDFYREQK